MAGHRGSGALRDLMEWAGLGWDGIPSQGLTFGLDKTRNSYMEIIRSVALFVLAAVAEIGGAWLIWQGVREHRGIAWVGAGALALGLYGFVATLH